MATLLVGATREIPEFLGEQIVHCDNLILSRNERSCIVLARNLKFFEFCRKQLVYSFDLAGTSLKKIVDQLHNYKGLKGKWLAHFPSLADSCSNNLGLMETSVLAATQLDQRQLADSSIRFGKYIYRNLDKKKLFILLQCWDKLVVLERIAADAKDVTSTSEGYKLTADYDGVRSFKIVHGKVKYQAALQIHFENGTMLTTDFQDNEISKNEPNTAPAAESKGNIRQLFERVRCARAELQLHKATTQKEFNFARNLQTFGSDFLIRLKIEEKPMLARCGDMWLRFALNDSLVCGIPIVNNCSTENLTILKNLKPIFKINEATGKCLNYKYRLCQLRQTFERLETLETFFENVDEEMEAQGNTPVTSWASKEPAELQLLPSAFAVMLISLKLSEIMSLTQCPLFIYFEVEKEIPRPEVIKKIKTRIFRQHLFIKNLNFNDILTLREQYTITFAPSTLHQDFLTVAMTSEETKLRLKFVTAHDEYKFRELLVSKFKFHVINRQTFDEKLEHGEADAEQEFAAPHIATSHITTSHIYFNKDATTPWYGALVLRAPISTPDYEQCEAKHGLIWTFYIPSKEKTFLFLKLLFTELLLTKCNLISVELLNQSNSCAHTELLNLRKALNKELDMLYKLPQHKAADRKELFIDLMKLHVNTDTLAIHNDMQHV